MKRACLIALAISVSVAQGQLVKRIYSQTTPLATGLDSSNFYRSTCLSTGQFVLAGTITGATSVCLLSRSGSVIGINSYGSDAGNPPYIAKLVPRNDGKFYVVGFQKKSGITYAYVACFNNDATGNWFNEIRFGAVAVASYAADATLGPNNSIYFSGSADNGTSTAVGVAAFTKDGALIYNKQIENTSGSAHPSGQCIGVDESGYAFVGGQDKSFTATYRYLAPDGTVLKTNSALSGLTQGEFTDIERLSSDQWSLVSASGDIISFVKANGDIDTSYGHPGSNGYSKVDKSYNGLAIRSGQAPSGDVSCGVDIDPHNQIVTWRRTFGVTPTSWDVFVDATVDAFGETYILGSTSSTNAKTDSKYFIGKTNAAGGARWTEVWTPNPAEACFAKTMTIHPTSGDILVAGTGGSDPKSMGFAIYRQAPVALADVYALPKNTIKYTSPRTVTNNDRFWQGSVVSLVQAPAHGTLTLRSNGTFDYKPNTNFVGSDPWKYKLTKASVDTSTSTVTMSVR